MKGILRESGETDESLATCFERIATAHASNTALVSDRWQPTYAELNATANRLAHAIIARGGAPGDRVAILMAHDAPAVAAVVAVIKARRFVVALNPTHPQERLRELIADSEPALVISDASLHDLAASISEPRFPVVRFESLIEHGSDHNPVMAGPPEHVAALVYTSGSTGRPKAVMMTHRSLLRNVMIHTEAMQYRATDRLPLFSSLLSGQAMTMVWNALLNGAALCPFPVVVRGVTGLADWMTRQNINVYASSASIFRNFMKTLDRDFRFSGARAVRLSSEPATSDDFELFRAHFPDDCWFVHTLSSSETCNIAWSRRMHHDRVPRGRLPIGAVSSGQQVLILDPDDTPVAAGEVGEIVVRSRNLAAGYWRNPEMTAERFSADLDGHGTRLFRTGDFGSIDGAGMLEFHGRRDDRVKIRGNRIELSEIEAALHKLRDIKRAVVEAIARPGGEPLIVGFVALDSESSWSASELRLALRAVLPNHMVPSDFVMLPELPFTSSGKVNREKIRQDYRPRRQRSHHRPPKTGTELFLAGLWTEEFDLGDIGQDDDFFILGGDSLMASVVAARVHDALGVELDLSMFAEHPTLQGLSLAIDGLLRTVGPGADPPIAPAPRGIPIPMSLSQERIWTISRAQPPSAAYTAARVYRIAGPLDPALLRDCMDELARRHDILRTRFAERDGQPAQIVDPSMPLPPLQYVDLSGKADPQSEAGEIVRASAAHAFDLTRGPLLRFSLVRLRENEYWLVRVLHHIIFDNISADVYFDELARLYEAGLRGEPMPLPQAPALQFGDYAAWQRNALSRDGVAFRKSVNWWKANLTGAPLTLRLPFERGHNTAKVTPADGIQFWGVERQTSHRLNALSSSHSVTRAMVRLAGLAALLAAEARVTDVIIGMYASGRTRLQLRNMLGDFSNLLTLRFRYDPSKTFAEWLAVVRAQVLGADAHRATPYEQLRAELDRGGIRPPEIQVIFHVALPHRVIEFAGLSLSTLERSRQSFPWGFTALFDDQNEDSGCQMIFDPRIYDPAKVRLFVERYNRLLDAMSHFPDRTMDALLAMSRSQRA